MRLWIHLFSQKTASIREIVGFPEKRDHRKEGGESSFRLDLGGSGEGICFEDPKHPRLIAGGARREAVGWISEAKV